MNHNYIIASSKIWHPNLIEKLSKEVPGVFYLITDKDALNLEKIKKVNPRYIFFPHWSYIIPREIYESYECVIFHMTDVPFGRGGSPLQNLLAREIYETKISALKCIRELDAGPVYLKKPLLLDGRAEDIYKRATDIIIEMTIEIVKNNPIPQPQIGDPVVFSRRKPEESNISELKDMKKVYDYIRMLDAEGYPNSFIETGSLRFEFANATFSDKNEIIASVKIKRIGDEKK